MRLLGLGFSEWRGCHDVGHRPRPHPHPLVHLYPHSCVIIPVCISISIALALVLALPEWHFGDDRKKAQHCARILLMGCMGKRGILFRCRHPAHQPNSFLEGVMHDIGHLRSQASGSCYSRSFHFHDRRRWFSKWRRKRCSSSGESGSLSRDQHLVRPEMTILTLGMF